MTGRVLIFASIGPDRSQAALIVDGKLEDLLRDPPDGNNQPGVGVICWAKVDRLLSNGGGAFVQLGDGHTGFLREAKGVRPGSALLVQVSSLPEAGKAAPVTRRLLYKSRLVIHTPGAPGINVSRRVRDPERRAELEAIVASWTPPGDLDTEAQNRLANLYAEGGFIARSSARGADPDEIRSHVTLTLTDRAHKEALARTAGRGRALNSQMAALEAVRDWGEDGFDMIAVSDELARSFRDPAIAARWGIEDSLMPLLTGGDGDPFDHFGVWDEIERLKSARADLPSGAWMAIEATRAIGDGRRQHRRPV